MDECELSKSGYHCWTYAQAQGICIRKCKHCGKLEACYADQAFSLWDYVPAGYTRVEFDDTGGMK